MLGVMPTATKFLPHRWLILTLEFYMTQKMHHALIATILKNLGHNVPSDMELDKALKKAFFDLKTSQGIDPDAIKYKISLTPVETDWVKKTFP